MEQNLDESEGWVDQHADALYRFALMRVGDEHIAEDLVQDTFLAAFQGKAAFRGEASVRTWLIAILRLKLIDHLRREAKTTQRQDSELREEPVVFERKSRLNAWDCDPSKTLENKEFWTVFQSCTDKLPATLARAYLMRELDGCTTQQICELLGISTKNLSVRLFRARNAIRDCLDKHWFTKD